MAVSFFGKNSVMLELEELEEKCCRPAGWTMTNAGRTPILEVLKPLNVLRS